MRRSAWRVGRFWSVREPHGPCGLNARFPSDESDVLPGPFDVARYVGLTYAKAKRGDDGFSLDPTCLTSVCGEFPQAASGGLWRAGHGAQSAISIGQMARPTRLTTPRRMAILVDINPSPEEC